MNTTIKSYIRKSIFSFLGKDEGWSVDWCLRYTPIVNLIKKEEKNSRKEKKILEIGCGSGVGLTHFLNRKVIGLDLKFDTEPFPINNHISPVIGSSINAPFHRGIFDMVVAVDILEHISAEERYNALYDMMRILTAKGKLILSFPCGTSSEKMEYLLNEQVKKRTGKDHIFLSEHIACGLPAVDTVKTIITRVSEDQNLSYMLTIKKNVNVYVNFYIQTLLLSNIKNPFNLALRVLMKIFFPLLKRLNYGECYRSIFIIERAS